MLEINKIHLGDCLELMKEIPTGSVDMILADLPYGTTRNKWDSVINLPALWGQYERIIKEDGAVVLFAQKPFDSVLGASKLNLLRYEWVWEKNKATGHLNAKKMPLKAHENILVFYKKLPLYNPQGLMKKKVPTIRKGGNGNGTNYGKSNKDAVQEYENYPRDLLKYDIDKNGKHPTQKPIKLIEYLIKTYTNENDIILDNVIGSGTTAAAAINTNRRFIGIEKDETYYKIACERIGQAYES